MTIQWMVRWWFLVHSGCAGGFASCGKCTCNFETETFLCTGVFSSCLGSSKNLKTFFCRHLLMQINMEVKCDANLWSLHQTSAIEFDETNGVLLRLKFMRQNLSASSVKATVLQVDKML